MTRRLLIQFGVATVSLVVTGGMALADSQNGSALTTVNLVQQDTSSASSSVTSNYSLSTTIGPGSGGSNQSGGGQAGGTTGPTGGSAAANGSGGAAAALLPSPNGGAPGAQNPTTPDGGATPPSADSGQPAPAASTAGTPPSTLPASSTTSAGSFGASSYYSSQPVNLTQLVDQASLAAAASANPPQLVADTNPSVPTPPSSGLPRNAAGFLAEFPLLMAQVMIPVVHSLPLATAGVTLAATLILLTAAGLTGSVTALSRNTHTARLRRSGFLGAARSDVGAAAHLFATPPEMSSMLVCVT